MTSAARRRPRWCRRRRQRQQALVRLHVTPYYLMAMPYYPSPFSVSMRIYICAHHRHRRLEQSALNNVRRHRHTPYTLSLPLSFGQNFPPDHRCMINIQQPLKSSLDIVAVTILASAASYNIPPHPKNATRQLCHNNPLCDMHH